jgi:hypothetical protein
VRRRPEEKGGRLEGVLEEKPTIRTIGAAALGKTCVEDLLAT